MEQNESKKTMSDDCSSCDLPSTHKCCPPTAMWRKFCLLRFRPGPVRSLLSNLVHRNFHLDHHVDTSLRVDTRSTQSDRPQVAPNSRRSEAHYKCMPLHSAEGNGTVSQNDVRWTAFAIIIEP